MSFTRLPFDEVFADESGGNVKTPQGEYLPVGSFPVVDQGKALIGGYVDDASRLCGGGRPAIVFGDHTRCVKYVDFPFCMGADGVKVLRPKINSDLKYLYHYLQTIRLPDGGYDRHYKYLKRTEVVIPPVSEQSRIAAILDQADALRAKRREALALLDELQRGIFIEMFGESTNYPQARLDELCELITDGTHQTPTYADEGVIFLSAKNVTSGKIDWVNVKYIPELLHLDLHKRLAPQRNDILLAKNGTTGVAAIVDRDSVFDIYVSLALLRPKGEFRPRYIHAAINSDASRKHFSGALKGIGVPNLHLKEIRATRVPCPPLAVQIEFESRVARLESVRADVEVSLATLDALFSSLQHRAFRGEL